MDRRSFMKFVGGLVPLSLVKWGGFGFWKKSKDSPASVFEYGQEKILRPFCCECAEQTLLTFEDRFVGDGRLRRLIELTRKYGKGEIPYSEVVPLRTEMWEFRQVIDYLDTWEARGPTGNLFSVKQAIDITICASAKPITQDVFHWLLSEHLWYVRVSNLDDWIEWVKDSPYYQRHPPTSFVDEANRLLTERIQIWQLKCLTSYMTGKHETLMKENPPREFVPIEFLVGVEEGDFMDPGDARKAARGLAKRLNIKVREL